jgi:hypothetical protein
VPIEGDHYMPLCKLDTPDPPPSCPWRWLTSPHSCRD